MRRVVTFLLVLVVLGGLLGASLGFRLAEHVTPEYILENMGQTIEATQSLQGHFSVQIKPQQGVAIAAELKGKVWVKKPAKLRLELQQAPVAELEGVTVIIDGETVCLYNPAMKSAVIEDLGSLAKQFFANLSPNLSLESPPPEKPDIRDLVKLDGKETIGGRRTYRLKLIPPQVEGLPEMLGMLWVEEQTWVPLQVKAAIPGAATWQATLLDYQLDEGVPDSLFVCQFPPGTEVRKFEDLAPRIGQELVKPKALTLKEARASSPFPLLVPAWVPEGFQMRSVFQSSGEIYTLSYVGGGGRNFSIVQGPAELRLALGASRTGQTTTLPLRGGGNATLMEDQALGESFLTWRESEVDIAIIGNLSQAEAVKVAESLAP